MPLSISSNKFVPPQLNINSVPRNKLIGLLSERMDELKLTVFQAPAGYGKTTSMLQFYQLVKESGHQSVWITLDEEDNDLVRYLQCFSIALQDIPKVDYSENKQDSQPIGALQEMIEDVEDSLFIFLDEFETIYEPSLLTLLMKFIHQLPSNKHVVIGSRELPDFQISKMMIGGQALVIDANHLRFCEEEAEFFLKNIASENFTTKEINSFYKVTEGWPAAMQLAAMTYSDLEFSPEDLLPTLNKDPLLSTYIIENVLNSLPNEVADFLLKTCCLRRLNASLCNALAGINNSQQILESLSNKGMFIQPIDHQKKWFVHHKLFSGLLKQESLNSRPNEYEKMCRHAALWFDVNGRKEVAIDYAIRAEDFDLAGQIIDQNIQELLFDARVGTITRWTQLLGNDEIDRFPNIQLAAGWAAIFHREFDNANALIQSLEKLPVDERKKLSMGEYSVEVLKASSYLLQDKTDIFFEYTSELLEYLSSLHIFNRLAVININTLALLGNRKIREARTCLETSLPYRRQSTSVFTNAYFDGILAFSYIYDGQLDSSLNVLESAQNQFESDITSGSIPKAIYAPIKAIILYEKNKLDEAIGLLEEQFPIIHQFGLPDWIMISYTLLSRAYFNKGNYAKALTLLDDMGRFGYTENFSRLVSASLYEKVRLFTLKKDNEKASNVLMEISVVEMGHSKLNFFSSESEHLDLAELRLSIHQDPNTSLNKKIKTLIEESTRASISFRTLKLKILLCILLKKQGKLNEALDLLSRCIEEFSPLGFRRTILDEGSDIRELINKVTTTDEFKNFIESSGDLFIKKAINNAGTLEKSNEVSQSMVESLTNRELQILEQIAAGKPNKKIALDLFVSEATIKWHLGNIYGKLGVKQRTQAIATARELGLLN